MKRNAIIAAVLCALAVVVCWPEPQRIEHDDTLDPIYDALEPQLVNLRALDRELREVEAQQRDARNGVRLVRLRRYR